MSIKTTYQDREYERIVAPILEIEEFERLKDIDHHGIDRHNHSLRVSYYSYKIAKLLHLNYIETARAGLLHDFFFEEKEEGQRLKTLVTHPKTAVENAKMYFDLTEREEDIIATHMFPISFHPPKYLESWIVDIVDDFSGIYEKCYAINRKIVTTTSYFFLLVLFSGLK